MLSIQLSGFESTHVIDAARAALTAYAEHLERAERERTATGVSNQWSIGSNGAAFGSNGGAFGSNGAAGGGGGGGGLEVPPPVTVVAGAAPAAETAPAAAEPKTSKSTGKRKAAQAEPKTEPAETATADQSAVIAEAKAEIEAAAATGVREVKVEDIRAVAAKFNTDELRAIALDILGRFGVSSVSALKDCSDEQRAEALATFEQTYEEQTA